MKPDRTAAIIIAGAVASFALMGWWNHEQSADRAALTACRAELAAVRDSLATERADLIACYQSKRMTVTPMAVFGPIDSLEAKP